MASALLCVKICATMSKGAISSVTGASLLNSIHCAPVANQSRGFANQARSAFRRANVAARGKTLKQRLLSPEQGTAFNLGKSALIGASGLGLGCLCYYGLGLSSEPGAVERSMVWPEFVRDRIKSTYAYFGGSIALTAASAYAISRSPVFLSLVTKNSWLAIGATFAAVIGSGMIVRSIPYSGGIGTKQIAWAAHCGILGSVIAPLCFLGGPLLVRAAWYTAGVVGSLSALAACAPSEKFLTMGGPLACGLGFVFASSLGSMFFPPTTALGAGLYSISIYGGLVLFSAFLLYDTQRIVRQAETYPLYAARPFDPINASISIYLDTLNIFMRIAMILSGGGSRRK